MDLLRRGFFTQLKLKLLCSCPQAIEMVAAVGAHPPGAMRIVDIVDGSGDYKGHRCLQVILFDQEGTCINTQLVDMGLAVSTGLR